MTARDLLDLLLRISGLLFLAFAWFDVFYMVAKVLGVPTNSTLSFGTDIFAFMFYTITGVGILVFTRTIVALAYHR